LVLPNQSGAGRCCVCPTPPHSPPPNSPPTNFSLKKGQAKRFQSFPAKEALTFATWYPQAELIIFTVLLSNAESVSQSFSLTRCMAKAHKAKAESALDQMKKQTMIDLKKLWEAMPRDVQRKISCHDLKRITDNYNADNQEDGPPNNRPQDGRVCDCEDAPCCGHYEI